MTNIPTAPVLLLSMPQMVDPNFSRAVVLLCEYTDEGAFGFIVNRPMDEPASTLVKTEPSIKINPKARLWIGGPAQQESTWVLMSESQDPNDEPKEIFPGVLLSVSEELTLQLLQSPPSSKARVLVGCAGWGPGQLDQELAASGWLMLKVDPELIFGVPPEQMWELAIRRLGKSPLSFQISPGVH